MAGRQSAELSPEMLPSVPVKERKDDPVRPRPLGVYDELLVEGDEARRRHVKRRKQLASSTVRNFAGRSIVVAVNGVL